MASFPLSEGIVLAGAHDQSMQPGIPRVRVPQRAHVPPRCDQRVLHRVLGAVTIVEDQGCEGALAIERRIHQAGERIRIATHGSLHELSLHVPTDPAQHIRLRS